MARSYVRQNVVNRFKLQLGSPECGELLLRYSHVLANVATTVCFLTANLSSTHHWLDCQMQGVGKSVKWLITIYNSQSVEIRNPGHQSRQVDYRSYLHRNHE